MSTKDEVKKINTEALMMAVGSEPLSLVDQLKVKRSRIAQEAKSKLRKLDRTIELLEGSNAESIMADARAALEE